MNSNFYEDTGENDLGDVIDLGANAKKTQGGIMRTQKSAGFERDGTMGETMEIEETGDAKDVDPKFVTVRSRGSKKSQFGKSHENNPIDPPEEEDIDMDSEQKGLGTGGTGSEPTVDIRSRPALRNRTTVGRNSGVQDGNKGS